MFCSGLAKVMTSIRSCSPQRNFVDRRTDSDRGKLGNRESSHSPAPYSGVLDSAGDVQVGAARGGGGQIMTMAVVQVSSLRHDIKDWYLDVAI